MCLQTVDETFEDNKIEVTAYKVLIRDGDKYVPLYYGLADAYLSGVWVQARSPKVLATDTTVYYAGFHACENYNDAVHLQTHCNYSRASIKKVKLKGLLAKGIERWEGDVAVIVAHEMMILED